jgi:2'-5' RNA ligase
MQLAFDFGVDERDPAAGVGALRGRRDFGHRRRGEASPGTGELRDNYFFALLPDRSTALQIDRLALDLRRQHQLKGKLIGVDRYHVSLHRGLAIGCSPAELVARMKQAADMVPAKGFALGFDQAMSFYLGPRDPAFVLSSSDDLPALNELHRALGGAMAVMGLQVDRSFTPHLTLLYDARLVAKAAVPLVRWTARDFVLIRSLVGQSRYEWLGHWPLSQDWRS